MQTDSGDENKAAGRPASASSVQTAGFEPGRAVDADAVTRWSSAQADGQWWQVDLGSARQVSRVEVGWETAYAARYRIMTSLDGQSFTQAAEQTAAAPGDVTTTFAARAARYVRVEALERATQWGVSFWEVGVYGPADSGGGDTTAPDTTISSGPSGTVASGSASFSFTSSETGSTWQCRLDSGAWGGCASPRAYSGLANGSHAFEVRAIDAAGNLDGSPASRGWVVDVPAPPPPPPRLRLRPLRLLLHLRRHHPGRAMCSSR